VSRFFSVVIPVYNRERLLAAAIGSVLAQTFQDFELIVVDDGSTDGSARTAAQTSPRTIVLHQPNSGPGPARNRGAAHASGDYIVFIDSDDLWFPWTLSVYRRVIEEVRDVAILLGSTVPFRNEGELATVAARELKYDVFADYLATSRSSMFRGSGVMVIRRDLFEKSDGFPAEPIYCEDLDFLLRCGTAGPLVCVGSPTLLARREHDASSAKDLQRTYAGMSYLLDREHQGNYPGGTLRRRDRLRLLSHQAQAVCNWCLKGGCTAMALHIYRRTFVWQLGSGQFSHLVKIPLVAAFPWLRKLNRLRGGAEGRRSHADRDVRQQPSGRSVP
jgi:GT2 family glycosyltransferase